MNWWMPVGLTCPHLELCQPLVRLMTCCDNGRSAHRGTPSRADALDMCHDAVSTALLCCRTGDHEVALCSVGHSENVNAEGDVLYTDFLRDRGYI